MPSMTHRARGINDSISINVRGNDNAGPANESRPRPYDLAFTQAPTAGRSSSWMARTSCSRHSSTTSGSTPSRTDLRQRHDQQPPRAALRYGDRHGHGLPATSGLLADIATTDADFNHIDGFDVLFGNGTGSYKKLQATNPGTFHYELDLQNETGVTMHVKGKPLPPIYKNGVAINDNNGGSTVVIITIRRCRRTSGRRSRSPSASTSFAAQNVANSAFRADGYKAVRAHPDDRSDDMTSPSAGRLGSGRQLPGATGITWPRSAAEQRPRQVRQGRRPRDPEAP